MSTQAKWQKRAVLSHFLYLLKIITQLRELEFLPRLKIFSVKNFEKVQTSDVGKNTSYGCEVFFVA